MDDGERDGQSLVDIVHSDSKAIFANRSLLDPSKIVGDKRIVGRDEQTRQMANMIRPILNDDSPPNILAFGPSGTGKSLITSRVLQEYRKALSDQGEDLAIIEINCKWLTTLHQSAIKMAEAVEKLDNVDADFKTNGKATHEIFTTVFTAVKESYDASVFVVDEIDNLVDPNSGPDDEQAYSSLLYILTRINDLVDFERNCVIALTNYPDFLQRVDGRAESTYNPRSILFDDYDSTQINDILEKRQDAFHDGALSGSVIPLAGALAGRDNGDARKAIDLLRNAGDIATREDSDQVTRDHVYDAQDDVERDRVLEIAGSSSPSKQLVLLSAALVQSWSSKSHDSVPNPVLEQIYATVFGLVKEGDETPKSKDTVLRYMAEFETYGVVESARTGKGRSQGMYKQYTFQRPAHLVVDIITSEWSQADVVLDQDNADFLRDRIAKRLTDFYDN